VVALVCVGLSPFTDMSSLWRLKISRLIRGELAIGAQKSHATTLYSADPCVDRTMMQSYASSAKLRGGGPNLHSGI
jgi:hypothetical protein